MVKGGWHEQSSLYLNCLLNAPQPMLCNNASNTCWHANKGAVFQGDELSTYRNRASRTTLAPSGRAIRTLTSCIYTTEHANYYELMLRFINCNSTRRLWDSFIFPPNRTMKIVLTYSLVWMVNMPLQVWRVHIDLLVQFLRNV